MKSLRRDNNDVRTKMGLEYDSVRNGTSDTTFDIIKKHNNNDKSTKKSSGMRLRYRTAGAGYWVALLLPIAIYIGDDEPSPESVTALGIIGFYAILLSFFCWMDLNLSILLQRLRSANLALSGVVFVICLVNGGTSYQCASYVALNFSFPYLFYNFIKHYPRSFTFGEGILVISSFAFNFWRSSQNVPFPPSPINYQSEPILVVLFLQGIFFVTILGARVILLMQKPWKLYVLEEMFCLWSKYCIIAFVTRIPFQNDDVIWFLALWPFKFLVATSLRINLITTWAIISLATGSYVFYKNYRSDETTSVDRKVFHLFITVVFLPGIIWDHTLIYCCSAVLFFIFILLEAVRVLKLEVVGLKIGEAVDLSVQNFRDHQDEGRLILTPIYLLVGCASPIWLTGLNVENPNDLTPIQHVACLAGVLSIGVGDTFASIGGTYYGRTRWSGSRKTVEGTMCSVIAQIFVATLILLSGAVPYDAVSVAALIIGIIINGIVEGNTDQIDNLVLPLVTYIVIHGFNLLFNMLVPPPH